MLQRLGGTEIGWHKNWVAQELGGIDIGWHRNWVAQKLGATEFGWHLGVFLVAVLSLTALWFTDLGGKEP